LTLTNKTSLWTCIWCRRVWSCLQREATEKAGKKQTRICCSQDYERYVWQWDTLLGKCERAPH